MKIYVDKLPETCCGCWFHERTGECYLTTRVSFNTPPRDCPIKDLKEHDKQILQDLIKMLTVRAELVDFGGTAEFMFTPFDLGMCVKELLSDKDKKETIETNSTEPKKFKQYSGFDLLEDLTNPCRVCGRKPTIGNVVGYKEKYQLVCMNCNCTNMTVVSDDNFYKVIDKWNDANKE